MVQQERIRILNAGESIPNPSLVVYWMQREQRVSDNWALLYTLQEAKRRGLPAAVVFALDNALSGGHGAMHRFMLTGLMETAERLERNGIPFFLLEGDPFTAFSAFVAGRTPALVVLDFLPLRRGRALEEGVSAVWRGPLLQVDAHNVVPVWKTSDKREYAARTIRLKIHRLLPDFLCPFPSGTAQPVPFPGPFPRTDWDALLARFPENPAFPPSGSAAGKRRLNRFLREKLPRYEAERNDPNREATSGLSPYFHFGQIAPQRAALEAAELPPSPGGDAFLEELVVRRELSDNYCHYTAGYDTYGVLPAWARATLEEHAGDPREYLYGPDQMEAGQTHDPLWNAAQIRLVGEGRMHGYLRMYWAKKILEWSPDPETALALVNRFNDGYALDGRDPNGYVGAAWSVGGLHDRPWSSRPVFGTVRYMNYNGCRRKFDVDAYIASVIGKEQGELF